MERYTADLHIHSRFSRATSKQLNPRLLSAWARLKGIDVLGTGDFTHPGWLAELEELLVEEGNGLLVLKDDRNIERQIPWLRGRLAGKTRFMLQTEISSIYKRAGKVRKIHNLVYMPSLEAVKRFNRKLAAVGNLESDGRPILGLDSRNLLEMVLETDPSAHLIPAHIWTPWFSLFGSKSGFDSLKECYGPLSEHIFAAETGLSSDPDMNWMWSELDKIKLISNSDAHSGDKLGREANVFSGEISYHSIFGALKGEGLGRKFMGTIEFFPEEGKYHLDGHRKCKVVMEPGETRLRGGICPVCSKPVTRGVLSRVLELADRENSEQPPGHPGFASYIPLAEILSEILGFGPRTKKVTTLYSRLLSDFGSEITVLRDAPEEELARHSPPLGEALRRMRKGKVFRRPGYDGEYGVITVFSEQERREVQSGKTLVNLRVDRDGKDTQISLSEAPVPKPRQSATLAYNQEQKRAIDAGPGPVLVLAGPGTGKTQTLMGRIRHLLNQGSDPADITAVTFTRRAAAELRERLAVLLGEESEKPMADTLHGLAFDHWTRTQDGRPPVVMDEEAARRMFAEVNPDLEGRVLNETWNRFNLLRENLVPEKTMQEEFGERARLYFKRIDSWDLADYPYLLEIWLDQLKGEMTAERTPHLLVDEVQDLSSLQLAILHALSGETGKGFFAIGDPDQSIYGFRGAAERVEEKLRVFWPGLEVVDLSLNYRSGQRILDAGRALFPERPALKAERDLNAEIHFFQAPDPARESSWIGEKMRGLLGGTSHSLLDAGDEDLMLAPGDIAVLVRIKSLIGPIHTALDRMGLPVSIPQKEPFWADPRAAAILRAAGRILGLSEGEDELPDLPPKVLGQGPVGMAAYLKEIPPFDQLFWESRPFKELRRKFDELSGWTGLINWVHMQTEMDQIRQGAESVQIMSLHAAKGLEFEAVFMPGLEDGLLPYAGTDILTGKPGAANALPDVEEERRLFYVGLTRARSRLYLSACRKRRLFGRTQMLKPSRFLESIPQDLFTRSTLVPKTVRKERKLSLLD